MNYKEKCKIWLESDFFDADTKEELLAITDEKELEDRFYKNLEFGTGGLRGIIGAGDNRLNKYTVNKASQGLANYIKKNQIEGKDGIAIAYDSRNFSPEFAKYASEVFAGNGIKVHLYESLRPTPQLSYAVRALNCVAGIVITASHNPPEYNGYKVYWCDGAQVPFPRDEEIINEVNAIENYFDVDTLDYGKGIENGLINIIDKSLDVSYINEVVSQVVNPTLIKENNDISIVYTPIHGSGYIPVKNALKQAGFTNVHIVEEQAEPDGNFTTVGYPNPEDPKVFKLAIELAKEVNADVILGTDPDSDRMGAVIKDNDGNYITLKGNTIGILLAEYICSQKLRFGTLSPKGAIVSTIVSTNLARVIANDYNLDYFETLTGFKYIGEKILDFENTGSNDYVFGFEESFGYLVGTYARDKDAVVASVIFSELAAYYKNQNISIYDGLNEIYNKYGYYLEDLVSVNLKGIDGLEVMKKAMNNLRNNPPKVINNQKVIAMRDYFEKKRYNYLDNNTSDLDFVKSNVLYFELEDNSWCCVRPSGTEPKIKLYYGVVDKTLELSTKKLDNFKESITKIFDDATK
ncbi:MAG: phospho-sugar mutase [Lachnospirales bacterium]